MIPFGTKAIDWRSQLLALEPYFHGRGGVVHVRLGNDSPASAFSRVLRAKMETETWSFPWRTVQIDPSNASTHYTTDIVVQIIRSVGLNIEPVSAARSPAPIAINVASDLRTKGNIDIHDVDLDITVAPEGYEKSQRDANMITALCHSLKELLLTQRVAILFMESHNSPKAELSTLRRTLWDGALADLTEDGLLLIDFSDLSQSPVDAVIWPPSPNLVFDLPDRYDEYSRAAARDDLIRIALDDGLYPDSSGATAFAETALALSDNIRDLHARLSLMVTQLVKSNEQ